MIKRTFRQQAASPPVLTIREEDGTYRPASGNEIIQAAHAVIDARFTRGTLIRSPEETRAFLKLRLAHLEHEMFAVLWLDNRNRLIALEELFPGTIDGANVQVRLIVRSALAYNAASCILCHNHPSGVAEPSNADRQITERIKEALTLIGVNTLDHIIVAETTCSFSELGLM